MKRFVRWGFIALIVLLGALQLVPVDRANPPVASDIDAPPEVRPLLRRACYDCHSHETVWPWYSRVAPVSFLVARDVKEGRRELNFSVWNASAPEKQARKFEEIAEMVESGEMPLKPYLAAHPEARLTEGERAALAAWARSRS